MSVARCERCRRLLRLAAEPELVPGYVGDWRVVARSSDGTLSLLCGTCVRRDVAAGRQPSTATLLSLAQGRQLTLLGDGT